MADERTFNEEAGLGENWKEIDAPPIIPEQTQRLGAAPAPNSVSNYFQGTTSANLQHDSTYVGAGYQQPGVASQPLMPPSIAGNPVSNAAIQSTATQVAAAAQQKIAIGLVAPTEITVAGSPAGAQGTFTLAWASEPAAEVFATAPSTINGFDAEFTNGNSATLGNTYTLTVAGGNPAGLNEWALFLTNNESSGSTAPPSGSWSTFGPYSGPAAGVYAQQLSGTAPVTVSQPMSAGPANSAGVLMYFGGPVPKIFQSAQINNGGGPGPVAVTLPTAATAGNYLLIIINGTMSGPMLGSGPAPYTLTDTQGSTIIPLAQAFEAGGFFTGNGSQIDVLLIENLLGASESVSITTDVGFGSIQYNATIAIYEVSPFSAVPNIPRFRPLTGAFIPPIDLSLVGVNGGVKNILGVISGGTGLSAPGASGNVLTSNGSIWLSSPPSGASVPFNDITSGTNTTAAMVVGTGASVARTGSGSIDASKIDGVAVTGTPSAGQTIVATSSSAATWQTPTGSLAAAMKINGTGVSADKLVYINGVQDGSLLWQVKINGTTDGG